MSKKFDLQYIFSYLGILPYLILLIDKTFFAQIQINIINDFYIYYSLFIFVFIGAINWSFKENVSSFQIIYGFIPSIFAVIVLILHIYKLSFLGVTFFLVFILIFQLIIDYYLIYYFYRSKSYFYKLRLPLTITILVCLILIQL